MDILEVFFILPQGIFQKSNISCNWDVSSWLQRNIGAGDAMAAMAIAMAGIWRVHETATPGHHNRWHTLTFYYIKRDMKQGQIEVKMYICIK